MGRPKKDKSNWICCICGEKYGDRTERFKMIDGKVYCSKHATQIERHGDILPREKERSRVGPCCVCGEPGKCTWKDGKDYCRRHYLQIVRHGKILERTIYDKNEYIDNIDEGYSECIMYDKNFNEAGRTIVDLDKKPILEKYKIYMRESSNKKYALICLGDGQKLLLHRFILGIVDRNYSVDRCVDHINGNSLDNRASNLRICSQRENMKNIKKEKKICGVRWLVDNQKWAACIVNDYKTIHLGNFNTFEEAVYARLKKEKELFGEFGAHSLYYYILDSKSPIDEIKKIDLVRPDQKEREIPLVQIHKERVGKKSMEIIDEIENKTRLLD